MLEEEYPDQVIQLEDHVSDALATNETEARANWYGVSGIPDVRIDGKYHFAGASNCNQAHNVYLYYFNVRMDETGGVSPVNIYGSWTFTNQRVRTGQATATFKLEDPATLQNLRATILVYEDPVYLCCGYGGNDTWDNTTRRILDEYNIQLNNPGDSVVVVKNFDIPDTWDLGLLEVIAYLQNMTTKEVYQAARLVRNWPAAVGDVTADALRILFAQPNPFRPATRIGFRVPGSAPVELSIFDPSGRRVATLIRGELSEGFHEAVWTGRDASGAPVAAGVYFARLLSGKDQRVLKLIRLE
jgi:hypothetical protein